MDRSELKSTLHMCNWDCCIDSFPNYKQLVVHVLDDHVQKAQSFSFSQFEDYRVANGSVVDEEMSFPMPGDSQTQEQTPHSRKRKLSQLEDSQVSSLPSPPDSNPPLHQESPMRKFASLVSRSASPAGPIIPASPTLDSLISPAKHASQESSSSSKSRDDVEQQLTQDDDLYQNQLPWPSSQAKQLPSDVDVSSSSSPALSYIETVSPLDTIRRRSQSRHPVSQSHSSRSTPPLPSQLACWDIIPSQSQERILQTQAPYQSQILSQDMTYY